MPRALAPAAWVLLLLALVAPGCGSDDDEDQSPQLILEEAGGDTAPGDEPPPTFPTTATANTVRVAGRDAIEDTAGVASAVFPATDEASSPDAVVLVGEGDWHGGVAASVLSSEAIGAPILLSEGDDLPPVTAGTLARLDPAGADLADGAEVIRIGDDVARPDDRRTETISGDDPFELAAAIDRFSAAAAGEPSPNVVLASAEAPAFAMPAAAWAARSGDAVLFTEPDSLPEVTRRAIEEHEQPDVYVLGPESVISKQVERELRDVARNVRRIEGETPVENAIEFARYQSGDFGWGLVTPGNNYTVASSSRPLDAAAAASLATNGTFAPLLVTDSAVELPQPLRGYFLDVQPGFDDNPNRAVFNRVWILGDQDSLSLSVQSEINDLTELIPVQVSGAADDRSDRRQGRGFDDQRDGSTGGSPDLPEDTPGGLPDGTRDDLRDGGDLPPGPGGIPAPRGDGIPPG